MRNDFSALTLCEAIDYAQLSFVKGGRGFVIGQGVTSPWYVGGSTKSLLDLDEEVFDTPISESAVTGMALGAAFSGKNVVVVHPRMDFMWCCMDPIVNGLSTFHSNFGDFDPKFGSVVIRAIINRGKGQGAQHSQSLNAVFAHIPGLSVFFPATPQNMIACYKEETKNLAKILIEDRSLYGFCNELELDKESSDINASVGINPNSDTLVIGTAPVLKYLNEFYKHDQERCPNFIILENLKVKLEEYLAGVGTVLQVFIVDECWGISGLSREWYFQLNEIKKFLNCRKVVITLEDQHTTSLPSEDDKVFLRERLGAQLGVV